MYNSGGLCLPIYFYEVIYINRQSYLAELAKLLGFMSAWDRRDTLAKFEAMFDGAENEEALIEELGNPTKQAIELAVSYVPTPPPAAIAVAEEESEGAEEETESEGETETKAEADTNEEAVAAVEAEEAPAKPKRKIRPFGLIVSILFGIVIGLPIAIILVLLGVPFIALGVSVVGADIWACFSVIPALTMLSDILVVGGAGCIIGGVGLFIAWFGLWLSLELGWLWIGGAVMGLGRALTYKKEVAQR